MRAAYLLSLACLLAMTVALGHGFINGDIFAEGRQLMAMPWGIVSLVDLYTGFALFSGWILFRERTLTVALIWAVAMMTLGFFAGSLYALQALYRSDGNWAQFWMGHRAPRT